MSNTPETDKAERMAYSQEYMVPTEFARKLERDRDEALSQIVQAECRAERFCQERDEAREKAERYRLEANAIMMQRDEARDAIVGWENKWKCAVDMAARAELERDDAFNKLKELKDILR